jgi:hypothetical protein
LLVRILVVLAALGAPATPVHGQSLTIGGAIQYDVQRFDGEASLNRLDGESLGWMLAGGARIDHWLIRGEGSRGATIRNSQTLMLTVNQRPTMIDSELSHDTREIALLGGYAHDVGGRFEAAILGGISVVTVHRTFTTDAGQLILVPPSTAPATAVTTTFVDRGKVWSAEANVVVHATPHLGVVGGVRMQPISLADDISGRSVRTFAGMVWQFK